MVEVKCIQIYIFPFFYIFISPPKKPRLGNTAIHFANQKQYVLVSIPTHLLSKTISFEDFHNNILKYFH